MDPDDPTSRPHEHAADALAQLRRRGATLATAESLTGGQVAAALTAVAGASAVFLGGVVSYATEVKIEVLGVPADLVAAYGVVSGECARAMAEGVARLTGATYAVSTTGVAGPDRQEDKAVGTVFVGVCGPGSTTSLELHLEGDRPAIQRATVRAALTALLDVLGPEEAPVG